jgi:hypothetical protein
MKSTHTESDFDLLSWHDSHIHGFEFRIGDSDIDDWTSDLVFDIDFIVEWVCGTDMYPRFQVAPATLTFHDVTDLHIDICWGDSSFQMSLLTSSIDTIERERIENQRIHLDRPYYEWRVLLCDPPAGKTTFGATGLKQELRCSSVLSDHQELPHFKRGHSKVSKGDA